MINIRETIKTIMKNEKIREVDISRELGLSRQYISKAIIGKHDMRCDTAQKILNVLEYKLVVVPKSAFIVCSYEVDKEGENGQRVNKQNHKDKDK